MKRMINMGSIDQFRTVIKNVQRTTQYQGQDENDEPIYNKDAKLPTVTATYSEKNHGSNQGYVYTKDEQWSQSRKNIITPEKDNAGGAFMAEARKDVFNSICLSLVNEHNINLDEQGIALFMELSGGNIQKNACFSGTEKMFTIFQHAKVFNLEPVIDENGNEESNYWVETKVDGKWIDSPENRIWNMMNLNSGTLEIDFERPDLAQNKMVEMVEKYEQNSPAGNKLGLKDTILEGFVFTFTDERGNLNRWKVKGEAHSQGSGKVKTLKPVDSVLEQKKIDFVTNYACTEGRMNQMWTEIVHSVHNGDESLMERKDMGQYIKLVVNDVIKEESDRMVEQELEPKSLNGMISKVARMFFDDKLNSGVGL